MHSIMLIMLSGVLIMLSIVLIMLSMLISMLIMLIVMQNSEELLKMYDEIPWISESVFLYAASLDSKLTLVCIARAQCSVYRA